MIHLSSAAIAEVNRIKSKHSNPEALVRLGVKAGGCGDFYYTLTLDEVATAEDCVTHCDTVRIAIAPESLKYLDGLRVDYTEDLMGGGFRFHNPNASSSCGCGNSFSV
ncbi:HesB/IscA family protein [Egbenema bharatensis]|uniref:HesB/IscA family protein n=1 Tax=Egbenema bharatensis TaxID=3463334 RepID=UPI003A8BCD5A